MAKKFIAVYLDSKGNPFDASGPYHGEWTSKSAQQAIEHGKKAKASYMEVSRVTGGAYVPYLRFDFCKGEMYMVKPPAGSRYGPGYY